MRTKCSRKMLPINLYVLFSIATFILWIPFPEAIDFMGANSILYAFVFAMGSHNRWLACLALLWIPISMFSMVLCYRHAYKKHKYPPFIVFVVLDMLVSTAIIASVIFDGDYGRCEATIVGWMMRFAYWLWMVYYILFKQDK